MHDFSTNPNLVENFVAEEGDPQISGRKKINLSWCQIESEFSTLNFLNTRYTDALQV